MQQVIKYLGNWYMPTYQQDADAIYTMVQELQGLDLSKGEILQVVNTVPTQEVEVYTVRLFELHPEHSVQSSCHIAYAPSIRLDQ
jgi:hypothetical protein